MISKNKSKSKSLLKKGPRQATLNFGGSSGGGSSSSSGGSSSRQPQLRQASLHQLSGVVHYDEDDSVESTVPTTLYLSADDLLRLKETLESSTTNRDGILRVLRRLSTVPCTRQVLESTRIGVCVGHLRRHSDSEISELAARIITVWKRQVKEERIQSTQQQQQQQQYGRR